MKAYQLKENEVFVIGIVEVDDKEGKIVCVTKSAKQIQDIATGIWGAGRLIWLEVWNYKNGEKMDVELNDIGEWERAE